MPDFPDDLQCFWGNSSNTGQICVSPCITFYGHQNKGSDHQLMELLILKQTLLVSALVNV